MSATKWIMFDWTAWGVRSPWSVKKEVIYSGGCFLKPVRDRRQMNQVTVNIPYSPPH